MVGPWFQIFISQKSRKRCADVFIRGIHKNADILNSSRK